MRLSRTVIALMGPTASGKTELALRLARQYRIALISVDSAMVYRDMDIGTAKPSPSVLKAYPHALVDIREPEDAYTVKDFVDDADAEVERAFADDRTPVLVGGSMLYFRSFKDGISTLPARNESIRSRLRSEAQEKGVETLHRRLEKTDPQTAAKIHPNNYVRIERALEVFEIVGRPMSELHKEQKGRGAKPRLKIHLEEFAIAAIPRAEMHERVELRLERMFEKGLVGEVRSLMQRPKLNANCASMSAVGYKQIWRYLEQRSEEQSMEDCKASILYATRRLVRRQMTWLRSWPNLEDERIFSDERNFEDIGKRFSTLGVPEN